MVEGQAHQKKLRGMLRRLAGGRRASASAPGLAAAILVSASGPVAAEPCTAWPGEPRPLPQVSDADEMRARWAVLRVRELEALARSLEEAAPVRAHGFWRRVLCLDPSSSEAVVGTTRTPPVVLHRPPVVVRSGEDIVSDAFASLSRPVWVEPQRAIAPAPPPPDPREELFAEALSEVETRVRAARFEPALESASRARRAADGADPEQRARLEVLAATAEIALGLDDAAASSFGRALDADPDLELDAAATSPKVRRAFERAREARRGSGP